MVTKVYIPVELEKYLTCRFLKGIIDAYEDYFYFPDCDLNLLPKGAKVDVENTIYFSSEKFYLEIKGYLKITDSKLFDGDEPDELYDITMDNVDEIKSMYNRNEIKFEQYLTEVLEYDLYINEFVLCKKTRKDNELVLYEKATKDVVCKSSGNSEMKLVYGEENSQECTQGNIKFLNAKSEILRHIEKLIDSEFKILGWSNGYRSLQHFKIDPCKVCMDRCDDRLNGKPTMPVTGFEVIDINNIDKEVVVKYLEKIKEEMEQLKDKVVSERKLNKRITYDAFCWLFMFREFMYSDVYLLSSYLKAMDELNSKPNPNVKKNIINEKQDFSEILELKEYVATMGIDLYDFLDLHKSVIKMLEDN